MPDVCPLGLCGEVLVEKPVAGHCVGAPFVVWAVRRVQESGEAMFCGFVHGREVKAPEERGAEASEVALPGGLVVANVLCKRPHRR